MLPRGIAYNTPPFDGPNFPMDSDLDTRPERFWEVCPHTRVCFGLLSRYYIEYEDVEVGLHFSVFKLEMVGVFFSFACCAQIDYPFVY